MTLIYLSNCAIHEDGKSDPFMLQELPWLLAHFEQVQMVSYYGVRTLKEADPAHLVTVRPPAASLRAWLKTPFMRDLWRELRRLFQDGNGSLKNALKLVAFTQRALKMHHWTEWLMRKNDAAHTTLYSCWMSFDGYAAALSKRRHPEARFVVRGHAYDIDLERNAMNPYLMKREIAKEADGLYLISETAKAQYLSYMAGSVPEEKVHVLAMGSGGTPVESCFEPPLYTQGVLRIVSCAMVIPIKQVHLIVEALSRWEGGPVCWTHIGGGEGTAELRKLAEEKLDQKENVICELLGELDSQRVQALYAAHPFDVFLNTSRKEGVPISIMEAMRYGIPVIAPRVGGIPELVTPEVGFLYEPQAGADGVLEALTRFAALERAEVERMRDAAKKRWDEHYCSMALLPKLFPEAVRDGRTSGRMEHE